MLWSGGPDGCCVGEERVVFCTPIDVYVPRLEHLFLSILSYITSLGFLITGRTIHINDYPLTTENDGIHRPIGCESLYRSAPDGSKLKNVFENLS